MAYCQECGFDITEAEAFCPNCGIALSPPADASEEEAPDTMDVRDLSEAPASDETDDKPGEPSYSAGDDADDGSDGGPEEVPEDDFVDVSELRDPADEVVANAAKDAQGKELQPTEAPSGADEWLESSSLDADETAESPGASADDEATETPGASANDEAAETPRAPASDETAEESVGIVPGETEGIAAETAEEAGNVAEARPVADRLVEPDASPEAVGVDEEPVFDETIMPTTPAAPEVFEPVTEAKPAERLIDEAEVSAPEERPAGSSTVSEVDEMEAAFAEEASEIASADPVEGGSSEDPPQEDEADSAGEIPETAFGQGADQEVPEQGQVEDPGFLEGETLIAMPAPGQEDSSIDQTGPGTVSPIVDSKEAVDESREDDVESVAAAQESDVIQEPGSSETGVDVPEPDIPDAMREEAVPDAESASGAVQESMTAETGVGQGEAPEEPEEPEASTRGADSEPPVETGSESPDGSESAEEPQAAPVTGLPAVSAGSEDPTDEDPSDAPDDSAASDKKAQTTPNIGVGDTDGSKAPKLKPLDEGTVLNARYEIVRRIGGGGMGAVYLASDKNLGGVLRAVKEMVQSYIEEEQQGKALQDFKRESMLLTSLEHPSIPTIYDYFFDEKEHRFYLVMKYISGGDLAARLRSAPEGKLTENEVTEWAIQIADVLDYLHNRQPPIVYRDLKPANVMLDGNSGKVMLIDFGIARWINKEEKGVTAVGTMGYAPPELFSGNVVPGSDIYSLGSTMFHLMTGADPQNNPLLIFDFQKNPRPRQINPRLSDQMERILMRAVEYNAETRFASAAEMRDALTAHLEKLTAGSVSYGIKESPKSVALSDQPVFCGFCGQKIVATDMFCAFCGAKQPLAQPGVQSQEYIPVRLTAKLLIEGTSQLDRPVFELAKEENLVGRRDPMSNIFPEIDLSKFDPQTKISRKHARIWQEGENFMLEDLGSSNGTVLMPASQDSVRLLPHKAQPLHHGDKIRLGDTVLHFVVG